MPKELGALLSKAANHNILISFTASLATISVYAIYHHPINFVLGVEVVFATFFTYTIQRLFGLDSSVEKIPIWKITMLIISAIIIIVLAFLLSSVQVVFLGLAGALSLLYAVPVIPCKNTRKTLREIPYLKIWVILTVWIIVVCLVPLSELNAFETGSLFATRLVFILQQGAFVFALTIPFDIRDLKVDAKEQKTIPMILGIERSIKIAKSALWISFFATGINFLLGFFDIEIVFTQMFVVLLGLNLIERSKKIQPMEFYLVKIDGLIALQAVLYLLSYFI